MHFKPQTSRIILFCALFFTTFNSFSQITIDSEDFEGGSFIGTIWNDGGSDCKLVSNSPLNNSYSIEIRDNSGVASSATTSDLDLTPYSSASITFDYRPVSMDNVNEDFWLRYSDDGGSTWVTVATFVLGTDFNNNTNYLNQVVSIDTGSYIFSTNSQFRIQCDASGNADWVYIDNILIEGVPSAPPTITSLGSTSGCEGTSITINGTNLTGATAANVTIGGTPVTSITSNNGTTIVAVIGAGTTGTVSITTSGGTATSAATFTVNTAPSITSIISGARFGTGAVTLSATASSGTISWYASLTGGTALTTGTSYSPTVSTTTTYYVETNNGTCTSTPRTPVVATVNSYCTPTYSGGTSFGDLITNVTLGALNNASSGSTSPYYTFYNAVTIPNLTQSSTASVSITFGSDSNQYAAVWIDFNQDGNFDAAEGVVSAINAGANGTTIINIPVPAGALPGNTRMRVRGGDDSALTTGQACGASNSGYGETEDYTVNIITSAPPTITSLGSTNGCEGTPITINGTNLIGATAANVTIGGTPVTSITSNNGTTIVAVIGAGTTGTVSVTTPSGTATSAATFTVNTTPTITATTPASGIGTVALTLGATASSGTISWYANLTGGTALGTGTSFTTPLISTTTTYYVETNNGTCTSSPRTPVVASFATFSEVIVSVNWPNYSKENRVKIFNPSGVLITTIDDGYNNSSNTDSYSNTINLGCLEDLNNYYFVMYDSSNNGWDGADNITITVGGVTVINQNGDTANSAGVTTNFNVSGASCPSLTPLTKAPGGVTDKIQLWLKADKGITKNGVDGVTTWATQAYGSNATINTPGQEPTYRDAVAYNVNFNPVVDFGSNYTLSPLDEFYTYNNTNGDFMEGSSGFYTQDMFIVLIPDAPINSTFGNMDLFCGDESFLKNEEDVTGIGFGLYSVRATNEVLSYAVGTSLKTPPYIGYGAVDNSTGTNYNNVGIINTRNSASVYSQELSYNANSVKTYENDLTAFSNVNNSRYWIGRSEAYEAATDARIAEIITYSTRKDDTSERNRIESYLAIKYGITLGVNGTSQDYVDSSGALIWDINTSVPVNDVFNYNITGIGRDDASELNQKQSKTVNSIPLPVTSDDITIGLTDITTTNNTNANTFGTNKSFLVWGNNDGNLSASGATIVDMSLNTPGLSTVVQFQSFNRKWKLKESGTVGKVKVSLPLAMITPTLPTPGDYLMFISDSPTFSPTSEYKVMTVNGTNIETTHDFVGTKYITFGYSPDETFIRSIKFTGGTIAGGTDDYLDAGDVLDLNATISNPTASFTISAWIKRENTAASIVSKRDNGFTTGYNFGINGAGNLQMSWNGGSEIINSSVPIPISKWHHVAVVYDGTNAKLYIDGVEDITQTKALAVPVGNSESFLIAAADGANTTSFFNGNIDEVRVWDVALTASQLRFVINQEIKNNTNVEGSYFTNLGITPTKNDINAVPWVNLKGYYPMSTYTFTNCKDASGNGNTAALKNLNTVDYQTAPLPYKSVASGTWDTPATWLNNSVQNLPNSLSIIDGLTKINWNIVEISDNNILTSGSRAIKLLGLNILSTTADAIDTKLTMDGDNTAGTGNGLTVTHYLKLDGVLDLQGESQLIQTIGSDFDTASTGYIERDQQGTENSFRYNYWSSPVNSIGTKYTIGGVLRDGTDPNNIKTIDFGSSYAYADVATTSPIKLSSYWMYVLRDSGLGYSAWFRVGNTGEVLVGEGYTMKGSNTSLAEQNYTFVGKPNNGTINLPISANNEYLVGNPYASAIDAYQFINDNGPLPSGTGSLGNLGTLRFWEHYGGDSHNLKDYQGGYGTLSLGGALPASSNVPAGVSSLGSSVKGLPGRYIAVGQAFFVDGSASGGDIQFNNGQRIFEKEAPGVSVFMKSSSSKSKIVTANKTDLRSKFRIGFDAPKIDHRQLLLTIDENTTDAVDWGYDAEIYNIVSDDMYWMIDAKKYVIQATNMLSLDKEIPLGIETKEGGNVRIMVDVLENVDENTYIYVKDKLTGETYNITNQAFEINLEAGEYQERFVLTFQPRLKTLQEVTLIEGVHIFMNNTISELQLNRIVDTEIVNVSLFNYLGQQVKTWNINTDERFISLPIQIASGVYIAQVHTTAGIITKKIIIE